MFRLEWYWGAARAPLRPGGSARLAVVVAGMGARLERIFERRIPVAAAIAAGDQQAERKDGENQSACPHAPLPCDSTIVQRLTAVHEGSHSLAASVGLIEGPGVALQRRRPVPSIATEMPALSV